MKNLQETLRLNIIAILLKKDSRFMNTIEFKHILNFKNVDIGNAFDSIAQ